MKATVDPKRCNGCGMCAVVCPEVFRMDGGPARDVAVVLHEIVPEAAIAFLRIAAECCVRNAILTDGPRPAIRAQRVGIG